MMQRSEEYRDSANPRIRGEFASSDNHVLYDAHISRSQGNTKPSCSFNRRRDDQRLTIIAWNVVVKTFIGMESLCEICMLRQRHASAGH